ncbi:MAG: sel1 repeat family protein [Alphaproteobacteria bacterium]|nr:sel1 repeat family protein [Alphaproteobacteria bacterium]
MSHADNSIVIDSPESLELAEKMAENNDVEAAVRVGEFYLFGHTYYQDHERALQFLTKASKRGNLEAIELMAGMYLNGRGVDQDITRAAKLYGIAAMNGHGPCQFNLGIIYKNGGEGFQRNPKLAYYWLYKAALNEKSLGDMIYDAASFRNDVANLLTQEERMAIVGQIQKESKRIIKEK